MKTLFKKVLLSYLPTFLKILKNIFFQENYEQAKKLIESAAGKGSDMVFLPEAFDFIGTNSQETRQLAEDLQGNTIT